jgi:hypothetical protein
MTPRKPTPDIQGAEPKPPEVSLAWDKVTHGIPPLDLAKSAIEGSGLNPPERRPLEPRSETPEAARQDGSHSSGREQLTAAIREARNRLSGRSSPGKRKK